MAGNQENQEQQEQRKSSVDRVNDVINKSRSTYQKAKHLRNVYRGIRAARTTAAVVQGAVATSEVWVPILVIGIIIFLIIVVFIIVFGGGGVRGGLTGEPGGSYACDTCQATACTGADVPDPNGRCAISTDICCVPLPPPGGIQPTFQFYCQYDDNWDAGVCKITPNGCGPTSIAMIMASFEGKEAWDPLKVALANGAVAGCNDGTSWNELWYTIKPWLESPALGYDVGRNLASGEYFNVELARQYLSNGYFILGGANIMYNTNLSGSGGHAFVITSIDSNNYATVYDPTFCSQDDNGRTRTFDVLCFNPPGSYSGTASCPLLSNVHNGYVYNYWLWAVPIKKL